MSALAGLRVIELAGQYTSVAGRLLAELGAEVVVVEPPEGSPERRRPPFAGGVAHPDRSLRWWGLSAGKQSVTVDVSTDEGAAALRRLYKTADLVIEGEGDRLIDLSLDYETFAGELPELIWVTVTPFGRDSPRADQPVTDLTMLAGGGLVWNCGYDDRTIAPIRGAGDQALNIAGLYGAIGSLVALAHRDQTGEGQRVDVNVNAACNVSCEQVSYFWMLIQKTCRRQTGRHAYFAETAPVQVRCADGHYATTGVLPRDPAQFAELHRWLSELDLLEDLPEAVFLEIAAQRTTSLDMAVIGMDDETTAILAAAREAINLIASRMPAKEFFLASQRRGFPAGAVLTPDEGFEDEHIRARGFPVTVEHPELGESFRYPGTPYLFSARPPAAPSRPPLLGEHNSLLGGVK